MNYKKIILQILPGMKSILLDNKSVKQTIFKNSFWMSLSEGFNKILKLVLLIYVARILGAMEYGKLTFAFAFVGLFSVLSVLGIPQIMVREFARDGKRERDFSSLFSLVLLLNLLTLALIFLASFFVTRDAEIQKIIWILAVYTSLDILTNMFSSFFRARQKMEYEAFAHIIRVVVLIIVGILVLFYIPSVINLSFGYLLANTIGLIVILSLFLWRSGSLRIKWEGHIWKKYLLMSWPLALVGLLTLICVEIDSVMMGAWSQITETGWYNAAYRLVGATLIPANLISLSFYPALSKFFKESKQRLQRAWSYQLGVMFFLAVPTIIFGITLASDVIGFVYDSSYFPSILAFQILIVMTGFSMLNLAFQSGLIVSEQQKKIFWSIFTGALINVILNLILIPKYSLYGAGIATVITNALILIMFYVFTVKSTDLRIFNLNNIIILTIIIISGLLMYFSLFWSKIYNLNLFLMVVIGSLIYLVSFYFLRFSLKNIKLIN